MIFLALFTHLYVYKRTSASNSKTYINDLESKIDQITLVFVHYLLMPKYRAKHMAIMKQAPTINKTAFCCIALIIIEFITLDDLPNSSLVSLN